MVFFRVVYESSLPFINKITMKGADMRHTKAVKRIATAYLLIFCCLMVTNKNWEDIGNDKERYYFCIRHLHELERKKE